MYLPLSANKSSGSGIFIIAFCSYTHVHWIADCIGAALFAFGMLVIFTGFIRACLALLKYLA